MKKSKEVLVIAALCAVCLGACGKTGSVAAPIAAPGGESQVSGGVYAAEEAIGTEPVWEESAPANTAGGLLADNEYVTVCYLDTLQETSLKQIPEGVASYRVSIRNNSGEELWIKALEPCIDGSSEHLTGNIQNAEGLWDSHGLILQPGQEVQVCIGFTKLGTKTPLTIADLRNVDFSLWVCGDGDWISFPIHVN